MSDEKENTPSPDAVPTALERTIALLERVEQTDAARAEDIETRVAAAIAALSEGEPRTPSMRTEYVSVGADEYDHMGYDGGDRNPNGTIRTETEKAAARRANFELARQIMGGIGPRVGLAPIEPSEGFLRAWKRTVFEEPGQRIMVARDGRPSRAMDTAETGFGLELIGAQYVREMWMAARNDDSIVSAIREIPMTDPTTVVPIDGALPGMLFVGESTSASATAYTTSKTASQRVTLSAKKFTIQQIWSGEMDEDSIIAFTPFLREKLNQSAAAHLGSAYLNGDTTNAGTGNINLDDADPADTKHYLAWDGIRHYWLVDATGQGKNMAAALNLAEINVARGKLNGTDDDVDAAVGNINWGTDAAVLRGVADWDTYMAMLDGDKLTTVDKYGPGATIVTGELGRIYGIPFVSPGYAIKTEADGKASTTEANNIRGQITLFNPGGFLGGARRDVQLFFDRIQRTDQFLFELYTRRAFTRFGGNVAAGIYNISL